MYLIFFWMEGGAHWRQPAVGPPFGDGYQGKNPASGGEGGSLRLNVRLPAVFLPGIGERLTFQPLRKKVYPEGHESLTITRIFLYTSVCERELTLKNPIKEKKMKKYVCTVCGYVYDPAEGDPANGIEPGTAFEDLPDDWCCPECGVGKDSFEPEE